MIFTVLLYSEHVIDIDPINTTDKLINGTVQILSTLCFQRICVFCLYSETIDIRITDTIRKFGLCVFHEQFDLHSSNVKNLTLYEKC